MCSSVLLLILVVVYSDILKCYQVCRGHRAAYGIMRNAIKHIKIPFQQLYVRVYSLVFSSSPSTHITQLEGLVLASKPETVSKVRKWESIKLVQPITLFRRLNLALRRLWSWTGRLKRPPCCSAVFTKRRRSTKKHLLCKWCGCCV